MISSASSLPDWMPSRPNENMNETGLPVSADTWEAFTQALERPASAVAGLANLLSRPSAFEE